MCVCVHVKYNGCTREEKKKGKFDQTYWPNNFGQLLAFLKVTDNSIIVAINMQISLHNACKFKSIYYLL